METERKRERSPRVPVITAAIAAVKRWVTLEYVEDPRWAEEKRRTRERVAQEGADRARSLEARSNRYVPATPQEDHQTITLFRWNYTVHSEEAATAVFLASGIDQETIEAEENWEGIAGEYNTVYRRQVALPVQPTNRVRPADYLVALEETRVVDHADRSFDMHTLRAVRVATVAEITV